jgi:hypothetical protein
MFTSVRRRPPLVAALLFTAALLLPAFAFPMQATAAPEGTAVAEVAPAASGSTEVAELQNREASGEESLLSGDLPTTTELTADGAVTTTVDKSVMLKLAAASRDPCGRRCDGKDPASFTVVSPWGNYYCANDAETVKTKSWPADGIKIELRYSPRCRTAWTRGCCYMRFAGFSYNSNGTKRESVYGGSASTPTSAYTAMLDDAGLTYKACSDTQYGGPAIWSCTAAY